MKQKKILKQKEKNTEPFLIRFLNTFSFKKYRQKRPQLTDYLPWAYFVGDFADGEHFGHAASFDLDHDAAETLQTLLVTLDDLVGHGNRVAALERRQLLFAPHCLFDRLDDLIFVHCLNNYSLQCEILRLHDSYHNDLFRPIIPILPPSPPQPHRPADRQRTTVRTLARDFYTPVGTTKVADNLIITKFWRIKFFICASCPAVRHRKKAIFV